MNVFVLTPAHSPEQALLHEIAKISKDDPLVGAKVGSDELTHRLLTVMKDGRGVHLESLLCALGAIAGYACQASVRADAVAKGLPETALLTTRQSGDGKTYYFGDQLNRSLADSPCSVWAIASAAMRQARSSRRPDLTEIFKHSATAAGSAAFGKPRVPPENAAHDSPLNYVRTLWPTLQPLIAKFCPNPEHWPILIGLSIQQAISSNESALDPDLALQLVMEAAIPMSSVDLKIPSLKRMARQRRYRRLHPSSAVYAKQSA